MAHYKGIKKEFIDNYGVTHADGFWRVFDIAIILDRRREAPPFTSGGPVINISLLAFADEAAYDSGTARSFPETRTISATTIEQFPSISAWADLADYALQVVKNHPTQTYFNDGALVELPEEPA